MTHSEIIISLVKLGFNFTFEYVDNIYAKENQQILFTKQGFRSKPILMNSLSEIHIEQVKSEVSI